MPVVYEPGEEIQLDVTSKHAFFSKALSWREQKDLRKKIDAIKGLDLDDVKKTEEEQTDAALTILVENLTRTSPVIEITAETLMDVLDYRKIWGLLTALQFNMTHEDKKKSD